MVLPVRFEPVLAIYAARSCLSTDGFSPRSLVLGTGDLLVYVAARSGQDAVMSFTRAV